MGGGRLQIAKTTRNSGARGKAFNLQSFDGGQITKNSKFDRKEKTLPAAVARESHLPTTDEMQPCFSS